MSPKATYTVNEIAEMIPYSKRTIREWCSTGRLPAVRVGRKYMIPFAAIRSEFPGVAESLLDIHALR